MTHDPFNEARARAGEPIEAIVDKQWEDVRFIGLILKSGKVVFEAECNDVALSRNKNEVRMKKRTKTMYLNVWLDEDAYRAGSVTGFIYLKEEDAATSRKVGEDGFILVAHPVEMPND
jgi:hypothetical protein